MFIIIKIFILSWFLTRFKPIRIFFNILPDNILFKVIRYITTCIFCISFWLSILITNDIYLSCFTSFIAFWYDKLLSRYENRIYLK